MSVTNDGNEIGFEITVGFTKELTREQVIDLIMGYQEVNYQMGLPQCYIKTEPIQDDGTILEIASRLEDRHEKRKVKVTRLD